MVCTAEDQMKKVQENDFKMSQICSFLRFFNCVVVLGKIFNSLTQALPPVTTKITHALWFNVILWIFTQLLWICWFWCREKFICIIMALHQNATFYVSKVLLHDFSFLYFLCVFFLFLLPHGYCRATVTNKNAVLNLFCIKTGLLFSTLEFTRFTLIA